MKCRQRKRVLIQRRKSDVDIWKEIVKGMQGRQISLLIHPTAFSKTLIRFAKRYRVPYSMQTPEPDKKYDEAHN